MTTLGGLNAQQYHLTQLKDRISAGYLKNPQIVKLDVQFLFD